MDDVTQGIAFTRGVKGVGRVIARVKGFQNGDSLLWCKTNILEKGGLEKNQGKWKWPDSAKIAPLTTIDKKEK